MGIIREPEGVELTVLEWEMTEAERKALSEFIASEKLKDAAAGKKHFGDNRGIPGIDASKGKPI